MKPQRVLIIPSFAAMLLSANPAGAAPAIRTNNDNKVPACASPQRLTSFLHDRNPRLDAKYRDIAHWYRHWGEAWHVRWDYAFFQMMVETNALKFRRADGRRGDVHERQNNFAGLGATGGGVPGDRFPDVKTGVHAQIQHLVAYSGERLAKPVAPRTALKQNDIVEASRRLGRPVTFGDLARRWAADRHYARTIDAVAREFSSRYCPARTAEAQPTERFVAPRPAFRSGSRELTPPYRLGGPKPPQNLAGPEILPWLQPEAATKEPVTRAAPAVPAPRPRSQPKPQTQPSVQPAPPGTVKTIWSRETPSTEPAKKRPATKESARVALPAKPEAETKETAPAETTGVFDAGTSLLPHFRIAPATPEPSRLGGPIPAEPVAPEKTSKADRPIARFKEIITTPSAKPALRTAPSAKCSVLAASYGGEKTLLVRASQNGETVYTALTVLDGFEKSMFDIYAKASAPDAELIGEYPTQAEALADARTNCPAKK